jgi:hypothetical protein
MILDVEWEWFGQAGDATALCRGIREQAPGVFLGYTPNLNWTNHGNTRLSEPSMFLAEGYPWRQFDADCGDAVLPQLYWDEFASRNPLGHLTWFNNQSNALNLQAEIWPIQDIDEGASSSDLNAFFDAGGRNSSLWVWGAYTGQYGSLHFGNSSLTCTTNRLEAENGMRMAACGGECVDINNDKRYCGSCGHSCNWDEACCGGTCSKLDSDPNNCGACSNYCGGAPCANSVCGSCPPSQVECGGVCCPPYWDCQNGGCSPP